MIDLTKPVRRKHFGNQVNVVRGQKYTLFEYGTPENPAASLFRADDLLAMEHEFENIPEPRRPREWTFVLHGSAVAKLDARGATGSDDVSGDIRMDIMDIPGERVRVIEWPERAPLPEWPTNKTVQRDWYEKYSIDKPWRQP